MPSKPTKPIISLWLEEVGFRRESLDTGATILWFLPLSRECSLDLHPRGDRWQANLHWRTTGQNLPVPRMLTCQRHVIRLARVLGGRIRKPRLTAAKG